jgi:hypothetical protein
MMRALGLSSEVYLFYKRKGLGQAAVRALAAGVQLLGRRQPFASKRFWLFLKKEPLALLAPRAVYAGV